MSKTKIFIHVLSLIFSLCGYIMLWNLTNWKVCVAIFLLTIGNNIDEKLKRGEYDE